ncbi:hypothetical protein HMPREF1585_00311 [Gardnerella vaginalis JCP8481B]|nr:hypothetical protein HMPREF1585_00311 [Gardnerella vaginalis JCP8481B]
MQACISYEPSSRHKRTHIVYVLLIAHAITYNDKRYWNAAKLRLTKLDKY